MSKSTNGVVDAPEKSKKSVESVGISIPALQIKVMTIKIIGDTPLIVNNFSEKSKLQMLEKQMKKATKAREAKKPEEMYENSLYRFKDGKRTGIRAVSFKAAMVRAGKQLGIPMTDSRGRFHVIADEGDLIEIHGKHEMRDDMVRLATGVADIRFRGCYYEWWANVRIRYNAATISPEELVNLMNNAGFSCGVGEYRSEKSNSGSYGAFRVAEGGE